MAVLHHPLGSGHARLLRRAVLELATGEHRRHFTPVLHVGTPGGPTVAITDDPAWDHGLRTDLVGAALRALHDPAWAWVTRTGPLTLQDVDAAWLGPTVTAAAERGADVAFVVVTRHGWTDPRSGVRREWKRIRQR
ncbi:MAG: hypothetical protein WB797_18470 [Nocardioides sp.]